ncbi:hypothetical protein Y032_0006g3071 [Ancylostoma ceylanicum]|uniref:Secreted protein n=1 Tax=Ancylostoma ceylanicum TaxID=53326 RepID=A0A016VPX4_9BILA|nr:hypothetical protein Y032_0006g3071 [Ancylostoma ceylanicum]
MFPSLLSVIIVVLVCPQIIGARTLTKPEEMEIPEFLAEGTTEAPEADEPMMPEEYGANPGPESSHEDAVVLFQSTL